ncbi:MAG: exodeoxyribonuclease III, partial [Gammaproteobacteria bacterium]|nr:exodeoxyribonuclease III [Gammaproteobacteria bacterium]
MKIATWNVNSLRVRLPHVVDWLEREQPDVLGLQETKLQDDAFPADAFQNAGYEVCYSGQRTYNGVAIIARTPIADVVTDLDGFDDEQRRVLAATIAGVRVYNLYVPNGQSVDSDKYRYKLSWLEALRRQVSAELENHPKCVLVGDFNIAPEDRDVHDPVAWRGKVLCSEPEREALGRLLDAGFDDVFRRIEQGGEHFSWWDYRAGAFRRNRGL